jgi:hypothetical protein
MPTPESEAFLAKKPKVPPTFDGVDYDDTKRLKQAQDAIIREQWVQVMMGRLVREELSKCYYREGVNHLEKCGRLRGQSFWREETGPLGHNEGSVDLEDIRRAVASTSLCEQGADAAQNGISICSRTPRSRATSSNSRTISPRRASSNEVLWTWGAWNQYSGLGSGSPAKCVRGDVW